MVCLRTTCASSSRIGPCTLLASPSHRTHHRHSTDFRARDVLTHSAALDGTLQVLSNILVQRSTAWGTSKSRLARAVHNVCLPWLLTESHTRAHKRLASAAASAAFAGVRRHRAHHLGEPYYQQLFGYLDDARIALSARHMCVPGVCYVCARARACVCVCVRVYVQAL